MKFTSRKVLLFAISLIFLLSCKKGNDGPTFYVKLKVNGNSSTYTDGFGLIIQTGITPTGTSFTGTFVSKDNTESFTFGMNSDVAFTTGVYDSNVPSTMMYVSYSKETPAFTTTYDLENFSGQPPARFIFTITKVTDRSVEGHFTGNYLTSTNMNQMIPVTEGEFVVQLL